MDFEEWFKRHEKEVFKKNQGCFDGGYKLGAKMGFKAGYESRQAELDELQKRIDEALDMLEGRKGKVLLDDIVETLKGEPKLR